MATSKVIDNQSFRFDPSYVTYAKTTHDHTYRVSIKSTLFNFFFSNDS